VTTDQKPDDEGDDEPGEVLDESEAADLLSISRATLLRLRHDGKGPPFRMVGRAPRYSRAAVIEWLKGEGAA
jgi:excisionase family DNA binding protein